MKQRPIDIKALNRELAGCRVMLTAKHQKSGSRGVVLFFEKEKFFNKARMVVKLESGETIRIQPNQAIQISHFI